MTDAQPAADPTTLDELRREAASATGAARAGVDVAEHGTGHTARQIVFALAHGAADGLELRKLLRELATESERLSGEAVRLHSRLHEAERATNAAAETGAPDQLLEAVATLEAVHADGLALLGAAGAVRRRLPRAYGDPLELDPDWPSPENEPDPQPEAPIEPDSFVVHLKATVAVVLDVEAPERRRLPALRELVEFVEEAPGPATFQGGVNTLLTSAYELGFENGRYGGQGSPTPSGPGPDRSTSREKQPESQDARPDGDAWAAGYLRTTILSSLDVETPDPQFATFREIAQRVAEVPASTTLQGELVTVLGSAHEIGRQHGVDGAGPKGWA